MASRFETFRRALIGGDPDARFELLRRAARWLVPGYRLKWPQMAWWGEEDFTAVLRRFDEHKGLNADRRWMLQQLARLVADVDGHTAECGAWQGLGSYLIARVNRAGGRPRVHHAFDSFEGLSEPEARDGGYWQSGDMAASEETCRAQPGGVRRRRPRPQGLDPGVLLGAGRRALRLRPRGRGPLPADAGQPGLLLPAAESGRDRRLRRLRLHDLPRRHPGHGRLPGGPAREGGFRSPAGAASSSGAPAPCRCWRRFPSRSRRAELRRAACARRR